MTFYDNGQLRDSGAYKMGRKDGPWKSWYKNGNLESMGAYARDAQEGEWEYYRENGTRSSKEKYVKNKVASLECYDEQGNFAGNTCPILKPPVALGKFMDFAKYVLDNIYWPQELQNVDIQGKVIIEYTITKDGELEDMRVLDTPHRLMALAVTRFFETLKWSPAVSHNRPIAYTMKYTVPFYR
jgi:antitoxin component YwqK of YwqJK toxin-antitoxin module